MSSQNLSRLLLPKLAYNATISSASTVNGTTIDRRGFNDLLCVLFTGTVTGTGVTVITKLVQDSDSGMGSPADITGALFGTLTDASDNVMRVGRVDLKNAERYIRPNIVVAGTTPSVPLTIVFLLGDYPRSLGDDVGYTAAEFEFEVLA